MAKRALLVALVAPRLAQLPLLHFRHLLFKKPLINVPLWSDHLPLLGPCCRHNCTSRLPNCPSDWLNCPRDWSKSAGGNLITAAFRAKSHPNTARKKVPFVVLPQLLEINTHTAHSKFSIHPEMKLETRR